MPYQIAWEADGVCATFFGDVAGPELICYGEEVCSNSRFDGIHYEILDLRAVEAVSADLGHLMNWSAFRIGAAMSNPRLSIYAVVDGEASRNLVKRIRELRICPYPIVEFETLNDVRRAVAAG